MIMVRKKAQNVVGVATFIFFFWGGFFVRSATDIYNWVARQKWSLFLNSPKSSHGKNLGFLHKRTGQMVKWVGSLKTSSVLLWFLPFLFFSFPLKRQNFKEFLFFLPQSLKRSFFNNTTNKQTDFFFCKVRKKKCYKGVCPWCVRGIHLGITLASTETYGICSWMFWGILAALS